MQTADHLQQKLVGLTSVVDLSSLRKSQWLVSMQEDDTPQAGLPLQTREPHGQ